MEDVFINYRTGDGDEAAALIERVLSERFSSDQIFRAAKSIPVGQPFNEALPSAVGKSRVLLAVIGPAWARDPRLYDQDDWVRKEIEEAFRREIIVIPILKGRTTERLRPEDLPQELARLASLQSLRLDMHDSSADLKRIGDELVRLVPALKAADRHASQKQQASSVSNAVGDVQGLSVQAHDITGDVGYNFKNVGSVNTGPQNYFNYPNSLNGRKVIESRDQPVEKLRWLAQRFIEPRGIEDARQKLEKYHTVFLDASPGSGRAAAAQMLLYALRPDVDDFQELVPQDEKPYLDQEQIGDGYRVWIDLSNSAEIWYNIQDELSSLMAIVERRSAYFVLILPDRDKKLPHGFNQCRAMIWQPPRTAVLTQHLKMDGIVQSDSASLQNFLDEHHPLREIADYAHLIGVAREGRLGENFDSWCTAASHALSDRDKDVTRLVAGLEHGSQRALLLSTAMLHESNADSIYWATQSLLKIVKQPRDNAPILERNTLDRQFMEIGAERDAEGNVHFTELHYDVAVRKFFWTYIPDIRPSLRAWIERTVGLVDTSEEQERIIQRFCDQALDEKFHPMLFGLVGRWTSDDSGSLRVHLAETILLLGLRDDRSGRAFRKKIYEWSSTSNLSDRLADVIVAVCRDEMAESHPAQAVVRLHHLARHESRSIAHDTLIAMAIGDRRFYRQVLFRLTDKSRSSWLIDTEIFLQIVEPEVLTNPGPWSHALIADHDVRRQLADGWSLVFSDRDLGFWQPRVWAWFVYCASSERDRDQLLDVLINAGVRHEGVPARLYVMACEPEMRGEFSDLVLRKINRAQGVDFF